ncbi:hypothetical protein Trydic_g15544 [Trypoxylus dichotomus]
MSIIVTAVWHVAVVLREAHVVHVRIVNLMWVGVVVYTAIILVNVAIHPKVRLIVKDDFSVNIAVLLQALRSPGSDQAALSMVINFELLVKLNLVR